VLGFIRDLYWLWPFANSQQQQVKSRCPLQPGPAYLVCYSVLTCVATVALWHEPSVAPFLQLFIRNEMVFDSLPSHMHTSNFSINDVISDVQICLHGLAMKNINMSDRLGWLPNGTMMQLW